MGYATMIRMNWRHSLLPSKPLCLPNRRRHEEVSGLCFDVKDTHPLHIEPVATLRADDAHEHVVTRRTAHDRPHGAHVDGEFTNHPGGAAMRTRFLNERHFKWENFSQDTACGIPIKCRVVHQDLLSDRNALF